MVGYTIAILAALAHRTGPAHAAHSIPGISIDLGVQRHAFAALYTLTQCFGRRSRTNGWSVSWGRRQRATTARSRPLTWRFCRGSMLLRPLRSWVPPPTYILFSIPSAINGHAGNDGQQKREWPPRGDLAGGAAAPPCCRGHPPLPSSLWFSAHMQRGCWSIRERERPQQKYHSSRRAGSAAAAPSCGCGSHHARGLLFAALSISLLPVPQACKVLNALQNQGVRRFAPGCRLPVLPWPPRCRGHHAQGATALRLNARWPCDECSAM